MTTNNDCDRSTEESRGWGRLALPRAQTPLLEEEWMARTLDDILAVAAQERPGPQRWHKTVPDSVGKRMGCGEVDPEYADRDLQLLSYKFSPDAARDWFYPVVYGVSDGQQR